MDERTGHPSDRPTSPNTAAAGGVRPTRKSRPNPRRKQERGLGRGWRVILYSCVGMLLIAVVAVGLLYVRLLHGGLSLQAIVPHIERTLGEETGGHSVKIQSADLKLVDGQFVIGLQQVALSELTGQVVAQAPTAHAIISGSALRRGRLAIRRLDLVAPRLNLTATPDGGIAISFARASGPEDRAVAIPQAPATSQPVVASERGFDLVKAVTAASARARRGETSTGFLREIGLKQAVVVVANGAHRTVWNVPSFDVELLHKRTHSAIKARASIATLTGPLVATATTEEADNSDQFNLTVDVQGFNPRGLARLLPGLGPVETIDLPLDGKFSIALSSDGQLKSIQAVFGADAGMARFGLLGRKPVPLEATRLVFSVDSARRVVDISDFTLGWAGNRLTLTGQIVADVQASKGWTFALQSTAGALAAPQAARAATRIESARAHGRFAPEAGRFELSEFALKVANGEVTAKGGVIWNNGIPTGQIDGRLSPMNVQVLNALWPSVVAPGVRDWVSTHVTKGQLAGGLFKTAIEGGENETQARLSLTLEASGVEVQTLKGMPPLEIARGLVRVEGHTIEITTPEVVVAANDGHKLQLRAARFTAIETSAGDQPTAEVSFRVTGPLAAALDLVDREPFGLLRSNGLPVAGTDGKIDGAVKATFPLADNVQWSEVRTEGRIRVSDLRARNVVGANDLSGGVLTIDLSDRMVDVKGDLLVKGVTAKASWQYMLNQPRALQPPARLVTQLDNADRVALGLDVADLVQGETPVDVLVSFTEAGAQPRVRVDLSKAELTFEPIAWKKAPGRAATFMFDPVKGPGTGAAQRLELQNMKLTGDDIALEGWMAIGPDQKPREFSFPEFTLNVVSRLNVHGKRRPDNVWDITAKGPTFDGRNVFRSMFNVGQPQVSIRKDKPGYDITAEIDTVIGFSDTVVRGLKLKMSQRADRLTDLDAKATLATGKPFAAMLRNQGGTGRQLLAEGADAGQVFKVVGFYPNAVGGLMQLEVHLDGKGANEKSGTLWARDFAVLGDPVVSEVFQNADAPTTYGQGAGQPKGQRQRIVRQQFDFEGLRIPFDVGSGQFVMNNAVLRGPLIGATFRGKIDFRQQHINLGGTYVPASGLNQAVGGLLGPLTGGPQGEGLFGITFAVQGALASPQVIVNPLSLLGPGIFREIFQMTPETFRVTPRNDSVPAAGATPGGRPARTRADPARASSAGEMRAPSAVPARPPGEVITDWTSDVKASPKRPPSAEPTQR